MKSKYDIVVVGAGHNGLTAAAYLAKAGKKVLVLERNKWPGGGVVTQEMTAPGFLHDRHSGSHVFILSNPLIQSDELGLLSKYGLRYEYTRDAGRAVYGTAFDDGAYLLSYNDIEKTCEEVARYSTRDAEAYKRFAQLAVKCHSMLTATSYSPPAPMGTTLAMMDQSTEGRELLRLIQCSAKDVVDELFENSYVKIHLLKMFTEVLHPPEENGTGIMFLASTGTKHIRGYARPVGGSGKLTDALIACIKDHGGEVLLEKDVTGFDIRDRKVMGVITAGEEKFDANDAVIGSIHPHMLRRFFPDIDAGVLHRAERVKLSPFTVFMVHTALNEPLKWRCGREIEKAYFVEVARANLTEFYKAFDHLKYGTIPERFDTMSCSSPSVHDPSRAPVGKATTWGAVFANYDLADGKTWHDMKQRVGDQYIANMGDWVSNFTPDNIIAKRYESPLDCEQDSPSFLKADTHGCGMFFYQTGSHRPTPDLAQFKVPGIERFYLVGPFMHPGAGVAGGGRATAMRMFSDMKLDFNAVVGAKR
ncbi:MAG TPA: NAD(P)/FAD-dependent oxidoreductase [Rubrivivax sp.]|nr:NAD(P)/FAD-dependent oxidoreductase [Rubrivivax sp.]